MRRGREKGAENGKKETKKGVALKGHFSSSSS